jgi:hypothetical protein
VQRILILVFSAISASSAFLSFFCRGVAGPNGLHSCNSSLSFLIAAGLRQALCVSKNRAGWRDALIITGELAGAFVYHQSFCPVSFWLRRFAALGIFLKNPAQACPVCHPAETGPVDGPVLSVFGRGARDILSSQQGPVSGDFLS